MATERRPAPEKCTKPGNNITFIYIYKLIIYYLHCQYEILFTRCTFFYFAIPYY